MHAFLDDSGDAGMKFETGSTRYLVMAACIFRNPADIEEAARVIRACRDDLGRGPRWEFKHAKSSADTRDAFFAAIRPLKFDARAIIIDKERLYSEALTTRPKFLQNYAIKMMLTHTRETVRDAKLVIDGKDSKAFRMKNATYFRNEINRAVPGTIRAVSCEDSVQNPLIQLADMVAGAVHRHYRQDRDANPAHIAEIRRRAKFPNGGLWEFTATK